jgi:hypothetical protein
MERHATGALLGNHESAPAGEVVRPTVTSKLRDEGAGLLQALAAATKQELTQHVSYVNRTDHGYQNSVHNVRRGVS